MLDHRSSLKRQLLLWLLLPQLVLWASGGLLAWRIALAYAEKAIDQSLTDSVRALARQVKPVGSGLLIDFPRAAQDILEDDPQDKLSYMVSSPPGSFILGNARLPSPPQEAGDNATQLYDAVVGGRHMRLASIMLDYGETADRRLLQVQVARSMVLQRRIAAELLRDLIVPLLLLGTALGALVYFGVRRGLLPLQRLEDQLRQQGLHGATLPVEALTPIELTQAPTEVLALAGAVNRLLEAVRRSVNQERRFLNDAAHQLRTPLAGLISQTALALQEKNPDALNARLHKVHDGAERSAHLVHQLLSLARSETAIKFRRVDGVQLAHELALEQASAAIAHGIDFGFEATVDALPFDGEPLLLREALSNLIDNALRYAPQAGSECRVTLRASRIEADVAATGTSRAWACLEVVDNGPGLDPQQRQHVFQRFWRGSQKPGGCGLGMAIVQEIALRHGGRVQLVPQQPHGLAVQLLLPLAPTPA